jgi:hypothetical protein
MAKAKPDQQIEQRIEQEIVIDAYDAQERAMGWYSYLEDRLHFPFRGKCSAPRPISPLRKGQEVSVVAMGPAEECEREMFVLISWEDRTLAVPLAQLEATQADKATCQAVADWHYWVQQGYEF